MSDIVKTRAGRDELRKLRPLAMESAVNEYAPEELWEALDEIDRLEALFQQTHGVHSDWVAEVAAQRIEIESLKRERAILGAMLTTERSWRPLREAEVLAESQRLARVVHYLSCLRETLRYSPDRTVTITAEELARVERGL